MKHAVQLLKHYQRLFRATANSLAYLQRITRIWVNIPISSWSSQNWLKFSLSVEDKRGCRLLHGRALMMLEKLFSGYRFLILKFKSIIIIPTFASFIVWVLIIPFVIFYWLVQFIFPFFGKFVDCYFKSNPKIVAILNSVFFY